MTWWSWTHPPPGTRSGMLGSPGTFGAIARIGPIAGQTRQLLELLKDEQRTGYVGVALGTEMAVTEAIELQEGLDGSCSGSFGGDRQQPAAAALLGRGDGADRGARRRRQRARRWGAGPAERRSSRGELREAALQARAARSTTGPASSTTSWRGCGGGSSR